MILVIAVDKRRHSVELRVGRVPLVGVDDHRLIPTLQIASVADERRDNPFSSALPGVIAELVARIVRPYETSRHVTSKTRRVACVETPFVTSIHDGLGFRPVDAVGRITDPNLLKPSSESDSFIALLRVGLLARRETRWRRGGRA